MRRRSFAAGAVVFLAAVVGWSWLAPTEQRLSPGQNPRPAAAGATSPPVAPSNGADALPDPARVTALTRTAEGVVEWPASVEALQALNDPAQTAAEDVAAIEAVVADYRAVYRENPLGGLNVEITAALRGDNPKRIRFLPDGRGRFNADGELLDRWGRPYFFHKLSGQRLDVRSAGPDGRMFTDDDVTGPPGDEPPL